MDDKDRVSDWTVERLAAGDLDAARAAQVRANLQARGELHRLHAISDSNRQILEALPSDAVAAEVARRARVAGAAE